MESPYMEQPYLVASKRSIEAQIVAPDYDGLIVAMNAFTERFNLLLVKQGLISERCTVRFGAPYQNDEGEWVSDLEQLTNTPSAWNIPIDEDAL